MTHDELCNYIDEFDAAVIIGQPAIKALRSVVELHKPRENVWCSGCLDAEYYPCRTIKAIERELA